MRAGRSPGCSSLPPGQSINKWGDRKRRMPQLVSLLVPSTSTYQKMHLVLGSPLCRPGCITRHLALFPCLGSARQQQPYYRR